MKLFQRVSGADALILARPSHTVAQVLSPQISFVDSDSLWSRLIVCAIHLILYPMPSNLDVRVQLSFFKALRDVAWLD